MMNVDLDQKTLFEILKLSKDATAIYQNEDLHIRFANDAMIAFWGKDRNVIGLSFEEAIPELKGQPFTGLLKQVWRSGETYKATNMAADLNAHGEIETFYFDFEYRALKDDHGQTYAILHTATDVTDRVRATILQQEKERLEKDLNEKLQASNEELSAINEEYQATNEELNILNQEYTALNEELQASSEEIKLAYDQLQQAKELVDATLLQANLAKQAANLGMFDLDVQQDRLDWDERCKELFGVPAAQQVSYTHDFVAGLHPADRERIQAAVNNAYDQALSGGHYDVEYRTVAKTDGRLRWVKAVGQVHFDAEAKPVRFIGSVMDITEAVEARLKLETSERLLQQLNNELQLSNDSKTAANEELQESNDYITRLNEEVHESSRFLKKMYDQLAESEERFRMMAEGTDVMIAIGDESGAATYFNQAWETLTGRTVADLLRDGWIDLMHPEDKERVMDIYLRALRQQTPWEWEFRMPGHDGGYRWLFARGTPRLNADGSFYGYISSTIDITERKKDDQRKNDFIGMVSHELKTPITSLSGYLQIMQRIAQQSGDQYVAGTLAKASKQIGKMTTMINGFLNMSRFESGKIHIDKQPFDMAGLVKEIEEEHRSTSTTHELIFAPVDPTPVVADRDKIGQVMTNLLSNAIKYSSPGTTINIACVTANGQAIFSVSDQGMGIAAHDLGKLFDRYYRVEHAGMRNISGFGIGLYLSSEIIERHGGRIWAESELGKGSIFRFSLALA